MELVNIEEGRAGEFVVKLSVKSQGELFEVEENLSSLQSIEILLEKLEGEYPPVDLTFTAKNGEMDVWYYHDSFRLHITIEGDDNLFRDYVISLFDLVQLERGVYMFRDRN